MSLRMLIGLVPHGSGIADLVQVQTVSCGRWRALLIDVREAALQDEGAALQQAVVQNDILSRLIPHMDVVPIALGAVFSSNEALRAHVSAQEDWLLETAKRLASHCEYSLHIAQRAEAPEPVEAPETGRAFLQARSAARAARARSARARYVFQDALITQAQTHAAETRDVTRKAAGHVLDLAMLVARDRAQDLIAALSLRAEQAGDLGLSCRLIGPSAAFSFVPKEAVHGG